MAAAVNTSGSQTCVIGTEHTLATITTAGVYQGVVDLSNSTATDAFEIRVYAKVAAAGNTARVSFVASFAGTQLDPIVILPPQLTPLHYALSVKQTTGTGRVVPWAVWSA